MSPTPSRREAIRYGGAALLGALAGCQSGTSDSSGGSQYDGGGQNGDDAQSLAEHPGAAGLNRQPFRGAAPGDTDAVIIAFEDPSCPTCRRFEQQTLPTLETELLETNMASFVFRGLGIIYDWGEPAAKALEATLARSEAAHWALKDHYYAEQSAFNVENVLTRTETFLEAQTEVDGQAVVATVEDGGADEEYQIDLDAATSVGVSATPTFLLFQNGRYVTSAVGAVSYEVIATALDL